MVAPVDDGRLRSPPADRHDGMHGRRRDMYVFATILLLGLAVWAVAMIVERWLSIAPEIWAIVLVALGVGAAWLADFDLFAMWGLPVRAAWIGTTLSGLAIAGLAYVWREVMGVLAGLLRKYHDEAAEMETQHGLRRVA